MKTIYVITMWSGGKATKKWKSNDQPKLLPNGTGFEFVSIASKLPVQVIGSLSVEDFESGKEDLEARIIESTLANPIKVNDPPGPPDNISDFKPVE